MNDDRRKELERAAALIRNANSLLDEAKVIIEECRDKEAEYYDNMPENLQQADRGQAAMDAIDAMDSVTDALDNFINEGHETAIEALL